MLYFSHKANISTPLPISRWEPSVPGQNGTGIFAVERLYDPVGDLVDFYVSVPSLLETKGGFLVRHKGKPAPVWGDAYPLYANARLALNGPKATKAELPPRWTPPTTANTVFIDGNQILGVAHHYAAPKLNYQQRIEPGYYSLEAWVSAGTAALDEDGLAELPDYNGSLLHQFHVKVTPLV
jgi:hypothetical protein